MDDDPRAPSQLPSVEFGSWAEGGVSVRVRPAGTQRGRPTARAFGGTQSHACLCPTGSGLRLNEHLEHDDGELVFRHACKLGLEGIVNKRLGSRYRSGRSPDWLNMKNPNAPAVKREAEEDWGKPRWRPR